MLKNNTTINYGKRIKMTLPVYGNNLGSPQLNDLGMNKLSAIMAEFESKQKPILKSL
jgi:hypothetical protein